MENMTAFTTEMNTYDSNMITHFEEMISIIHYFGESILGVALVKYMSPIILILGFSGNILSFVVFSTKAMNGLVSSIFFRLLAVADTLLLCTLLPWLWIYVVWEYDFLDVNSVVCKFLSFLIYWTKDLSGWILSAVAVERAIGVSIPHHYKSLVTRKRACILLVIIILGLLGLNSYVLILFKITSENEKGESATCYYQAVERMWWNYVVMILYCICPFTIIGSSNVCVIYFVVQASYKRRQTMTTSQSTDQSTNLSVILIVVSVVYLCCTLPIAAYFTVEIFWNESNINYKRLSQLSLFFNCAILMSTVNSAANFFLYCLSGPKFRQEFKYILFYRKRH